MRTWQRDWLFYLFAATLVLAGSPTLPAQGRQVGFEETFALAADRKAALDKLLPGSAPYYYYSCLEALHRSDFAATRALLDNWIRRLGRSQAVEVIENRLALLSFAEDPAKTYQHVHQRLGLNFAHQRVVPGARADLPTRLDEALIRPEVLDAQAFRAAPGSVDAFRPTAYPALAARELDITVLRSLLSKLVEPDVPALPQLIARELADQRSSGFGSLVIHTKLTLAQLDALQRLRPDLLNSSPFIQAYLLRLQPSVSEPVEIDPSVREAHLARLEAFVERLSTAQNSLKAHVLYHRLVHDLEQGRPDRERFVRYMQLPRSTNYYHPERARKSADLRVDLSSDFQSGLGRVGDDEALVRRYLLHFLAQMADSSVFAEYFESRYLLRAFAEAKLLSGAADSDQAKERLVSLINDAAYFEALEKRVDIDFAPTSKPVWGRDERVALDVDIKNVTTLIVKVFEIDTFNYVRAQGRDVDASIELDGLVANEERTETYKEPGLRRVRRRFDFASIDRPGVYVIEFIGNGMSSRVVVRKGGLRFTERSGAAGHVFLVFDESGRVRDKARIWFGGRDYSADDKGEIVLPFTTKPGRAQIILRDGDFARAASFAHRAEQYDLQAGFHVAREALLAGRVAKLLVRPTLLLGHERVALQLLEDPKLIITAKDLHGNETKDEVALPPLAADAEFVHELRVPDDLRQLAVQLRGRVRNLSLDRHVDVFSGQQTFDVNSIDATEHTWSLLFGARTVEGGVTHYHIDARGKSGEVKPGFAVTVKLQHRDYAQGVVVPMKTDDNGRIELGRLEGITHVSCSTNDSRGTHSWSIETERRTYSQRLHGVAGQVLELPYSTTKLAPDRADLSFFELRAGQYAFDAFDRLRLDEGYLVLDDLTAGSYRLHLRQQGLRIDVEVAKGPQQALVAVDHNRLLEMRNARGLQIRRAEVDDGALRIQLAGHSKNARVHVIAHRYSSGYEPFDYLAAPARPLPRSFKSQYPESTYHSGRPIADEYRYILDRRLATKYPGNMLRRPGLLLNPWALEETETAIGLEGGAGGRFGGRSGGGPSAAAPKPSGGVSGLGTSPSIFANLDFLPAGAVVVANLKADDEGNVAIGLADLGEGQMLEVIAVDGVESVATRRFRAEVPLTAKDRALAVSLDAKKHFMEARRIDFVDIGAKVEVSVEAGAGTEATMLDSLRRVHALFRSLTSDADLAEFAFILDWPDKKPEEKLKLYSEHACHELHLFLYEKDADFFRQVVAPYLKNKAHKTFIDEYLLGVDLSRYLEPLRFERLNIVERILLARRVAGAGGAPGTRAAMARHVREQVELLPFDAERDLRLFTAALRSRGLDEAVVEIEDELEEVSKKVELARKAGKDSSPGRMSVRGPAGAARRAGLGGADKAKGEGGDIAIGRGAAPVDRSRGLAAEMDDIHAEEEVVEEDLERRSENAARLFRDPDATRRYIENDYWHRLPQDAGATLITANAFWADYAAHADGTRFVSGHVAEASHNFTEMMFALAVLDLPFVAGKHSVESSDKAVSMQAATPLLFVRKEVVKAKPHEGASTILVSQNYYRLDERYRQVGNEQVDAWVTDEFLVGVAYGCQVVVTNPSSSAQRLELLLQLPEGAMPLQSGFRTRGMSLALAPYATQAISYAFYFPRALEADHYPVQVTKDGKSLASAQAMNLTVRTEATKVDTSSWQHVSQNGTHEEVLAYLAAANLARVDLSMILWRMRDRQFYSGIMDLLHKRHHFDARLWSYAVFHRDDTGAREYLVTHDGFVGNCGPVLDSPLLTIDPIERHAYMHVEYEPLFNPRAHRFRGEQRILNGDLAGQYASLMTILCHKPRLEAVDWLSATYYLLLQDRVEEALAAFAKVDPDATPARVQYDYMRAYLDFYREEHADARRIALAYAEHPVERWRLRFKEVLAQLDEAEGAMSTLVDPDNREAQQGVLAAREAQLELSIDGKQLRLQVNKLQTVEINYYEMDVEALFSSHPFMDEKSETFVYIKPNLRDERDCSVGKEFVFDLPATLHDKNVLVEVRSAGLTRRQPYYANSLVVQVAEGQGQLSVHRRDSGWPLPKAYVKVFAKLPSGGVRFHKDGYTDLRGRFDYASLSGRNAMNVTRFAILVLSDERGAVIREVDAPAK